MITPTRQRLPRIAQDNIDDGWIALTTKLDEIWSQYLQDVIEMMWIVRPEQIPTSLIDELGILLEADIMPEDTETEKRKKLQNAVAGHKVRGTWENDVKIRIDTITGYSAAIFTQANSDDAIWLAKETTDPDVYWMTWQPNDSVDDNLGIWWVRLEAPVSYVISGYISIDCHEGINVQTLTEATINKIHDELINTFVPAYYIIRLGYVNTSGQFVVYPFTKATI